MSNTWETLIELTGKETQNVELLKKFKNTIIGIQTKRNKFFALFKSIKDNNYIFKDKYDQTIILDYNTEANVFVPELQKGYYEDEENNIFYITKTAYRQWMRGINTDNTNCYNVISLFDANIPHLNYPFDILNILSYEEKNKNKEFKIITKDLLSNLYKDPHFIKINKDFLISLNTEKSEGYNLIFHNHIIGLILENKNKLYLQITNLNFKQEIIDSISTWGKFLLLK